ncbi:26S proteasome non-ATPase regulatory subunit 6 [Phtheirospermum japonicum]|uniref:26S proteasome non-ATPase regulatory subunit 6 n=1 Tax=Phtheirospermum japonicum TaxID=374723 RepID=A0A830CER2_9LAMI|nr:26S proteasome non-ATPase regulatory subunit 6 [Phtheirospermum japonicum]
MQIPVIDLAPYLELSGKQSRPDKEKLDPELKSLCDEVSRTLRQTEALLVKDPWGTTAQDNERFLDMMERYFEMPDDFKLRQERPQLHYQVRRENPERHVFLFEEGGDWERENRLKVYEGLFCMSTRKFKKASSLFLDSILTFTTYDLFSYDTFIFYTVLTSIKINTISYASVRCKLEPGSNDNSIPTPEQSPLINLHASCFYELKVFTL